MWTARRLVAISTIGPRTVTCRSGDESGRWRGSGECRTCRNSLRRTPRSIITLTSTATSTAVRRSNQNATPLFSNGVGFWLDRAGLGQGCWRRVRIRLTAPIRELVVAAMAELEEAVVAGLPAQAPGSGKREIELGLSALRKRIGEAVRRVAKAQRRLSDVS